jgi:hypothetical protein
VQEVLQTFFKANPTQDRNNYLRYSLIEEENGYVVANHEVHGSNVIHLYYNDENELKIVWKRDEKTIAKVENVPIQKVVFLQEEEESIAFVLERMPSRMIKLQLKPYFAIEMSLYWDMCEEC